jgi:hypothetical protein
MARPKKKIDLGELEKLCSLQCTDEEIAAFLGVSTRTIERRRKVERFREIMDNAKAKGRISVRRNLFKLAGNGNVAAAIFLSKNLLGYKDVMSNEHSGPDGEPIKSEHTLSVVDMRTITTKPSEQREIDAREGEKITRGDGSTPRT